jgi:hypothetical protein
MRRNRGHAYADGVIVKASVTRRLPNIGDNGKYTMTVESRGAQALTITPAMTPCGCIDVQGPNPRYWQGTPEEINCEFREKTYTIEIVRTQQTIESHCALHGGCGTHVHHNTVQHRGAQTKVECKVR